MLLIHIGAGRHSQLLDFKYKKLLRNALLETFTSASLIIEKSPLTNTGYGSSLDYEGKASCDCTYTTVRSGKVEELLSLTSIGDCTTPTLATEKVAERLKVLYSRNMTKDSAKGILGLLKPSSIEFKTAREICLDISVDDMVLSHSQLLYRKYMDHESRLQKLIEKELIERELKDFRENGIDENIRQSIDLHVQDTIGIIESDSMDAKITTSSGGSFLRPPGRISCAGIYGSGSGYSRVGDVLVICLCSGNGEDIVRMALAAHVSERLARIANDEEPDLGPTLVNIVEERASTVQLQAVDNNLNSVIYVGVIALVQQGGRETIAFCHSTESFYFGFRGKFGVEVVLSNHNKVGHFVCGEYRA